MSAESSTSSSTAWDPGPPPRPPRPEQCCDRGCEPCIWTYHERCMERWQQRRTRWEQWCAANGRSPDGDGSQG